MEYFFAVNKEGERTSMTQWHIVHTDILDYPAEGLLCTAIPNLNLSGGVSTTTLSQKPGLHGYH